MKDGPDFKKFAAELVSPSELFESGMRSKANTRELIDLLGSLEHVTRFSLLPQTAQLAPLITPPLTTTLNPVEYGTSRDEYRRALLEDGRVGQALALLASHQGRRPSKNSFEPSTAPSVNVSPKKTEITNNQRRSLCQPILRET